MNAKKYNSEIYPSKRADSRGREQEQSRRSQRSRSKTPSKSPPLKVWDPMQAEQDKVIRKKEREDVYHSQHTTEEPLLLIKKREIITKYIRPDDELEDPSATKIIKKSEKSKYVNVDYETAKKKMDELNRDEYARVTQKHRDQDHRGKAVLHDRRGQGLHHRAHHQNRSHRVPTRRLPGARAAPLQG